MSLSALLRNRAALIALALLCTVSAAEGADLVSMNAARTAAGNQGSFNFALSGNGRFVAFVSQATDLTPAATSGVNVFVRDLLTGTTTLASVNEPPYTGTPNYPRISADGRYVAYQRDTCGLSFCPTTAIFVRDMSAGTTHLASVGSDGLPVDAQWPVISRDGRRVAFHHFQNGRVEVWVRDLTAGLTYVASLNAAGTASGNGDSGYPSLSADGRLVAFHSNADDLVEADSNGATDVFLRDLLTGTTRLISANAQGTSNGSSGAPSISRDGERIAFASAASDLAPVDTNDDSDVFVWDQSTGLVRLVSVNLAGTDSGNSRSFGPLLTGSGHSVGFQSRAQDLVANSFNGREAIFVRDLETGTTHVVDVDIFGWMPNGDISALLSRFDNRAGLQAMSDDGRITVFACSENDLVAGVDNTCEHTPCYQAYQRDVQTGTTTLLSATPQLDQNGNDDSQGDPQVSDNGRVIAFQSGASNLTALPDANGVDDIFVVGNPAEIFRSSFEPGDSSWSSTATTGPS